MKILRKSAVAGCILFAFVTVAGVLFRIAHWPYGKMLLYTGISGLVISALLLAFVTVKKAWK